LPICMDRLAMTSSFALLPLIGLAMPQEAPKGPRGLLGQLLAEAQLADEGGSGSWTLSV
jgi:hypothetical protein